MEVIPEAIFRKRKKSNEYYRTNSVEVLRTPQGGFPEAGAGSDNAGYRLKVMADDAGISLNDAGATNSPIYENYKENLINYNGGFNYQPSYNYRPSWSHKKNVNRRRTPDIPYLPPPPPIPHVNVPQGAIDVTSGQYLPPAAGGVIDPRTGTFHIDAGGGYINSQTGEFSPKY